MWKMAFVWDIKIKKHSLSFRAGSHLSGASLENKQFCHVEGETLFTPLTFPSRMLSWHWTMWRSTLLTSPSANEAIKSLLPRSSTGLQRAKLEVSCCLSKQPAPQLRCHAAHRMHKEARLGGICSPTLPPPMALFRHQRDPSLRWRSQAGSSSKDEGRAWQRKFCVSTALVYKPQNSEQHEMLSGWIEGCLL